MKNLKNSLRYSLYLLLALVLCVGCYPKEVNETINRTKYINIETDVVVKNITNSSARIPEGLAIVTVDKCEYITIQYWASGTPTVSITHKGNCKYCAKRALAN